MRQRKLRIYMGLILGMTLMVNGCGSSNNQATSRETMQENNTRMQTEAVSEKDEAESTETEIPETENNTEERSDITMQILLNGQTYSVALDDNETVNDIASHMPLDLSMVQYANHEYYAELPFTPVFDETRTSEIKAGHVYYWDGWNAFVINYIDYDISPYKVVHIGEITDQSVIDVLMSAEKQITIQVTE